MIQTLVNYMKKTFLITIFVFIFSVFNSCGIYKPADARKIPPQADERVLKNIEEGKGISFGKGVFGNGFIGVNCHKKALLSLQFPGL